MTRIALVVGHNPASQGAVRATDKRTEYDWNGDLAAAIMAHAPAMYRVFRRPSGRGYSAEIRETYAAVDAWGASASIELSQRRGGIGHRHGNAVQRIGQQPQAGRADPACNGRGPWAA